MASPKPKILNNYLHRALSIPTFSVSASILNIPNPFKANNTINVKKVTQAKIINNPNNCFFNKVAPNP